MRQTVSVAMALLVSWNAAAVDLEPMPEEQSIGIAYALSELANGVEKLPAKVQPDVEKSRGLLSLDQQYGVLIIPAKDLQPDRDNPALTEEKGAPVGLLFFHNILPANVKEKDKLFTFNFTDDNGVDREIRFAVLTIKKYSDEDFKLQVWGTEKEALTECPLEEEAGGDATPVEIEAVGGELELTWLGAYPCYLGFTESQY